jgi:hypothetical protein
MTGLRGVNILNFMHVVGLEKSKVSNIVDDKV